MKNKIKPKQINDKWGIEVFTDELGYVFMLEEGSLKTLQFDTKQDAEKFINIRLINQQEYSIQDDLEFHKKVYDLIDR